MRIRRIVYLLVATGLLVGTSYADEPERARDHFKAPLDAQVDQQLSGLLDAELDELIAPLDAQVDQQLSGLLDAKLNEQATGLYRSSSYASQRSDVPDQRMRCAMSVDEILVCTVIAAQVSSTELVADVQLPASAR